MATRRGQQSLLDRMNFAPDDAQLRLHAGLCDPILVTERLGELVPLLKFVKFRVEEMTPGRTVLSAPLHEQPMNQNGTHQASVFYLLADYTVGVGMFAALPGLYTVGIHDRCDAIPVQFWLRGGSVRHIRPGTGLIRAGISISGADADALRRQFAAKGRCAYRGKVIFTQDGEIVAEAEHEMGLYAEMSIAPGSSPDIVQAEKLKTSALMIAGLREDAVSASLAGEQGLAIARRMSIASPQLPALIRARSAHLTAYLRDEGRRHRQVVVLGAGLDSKPVRFASGDQKWFLMDFDQLLRERSRRIELQGQGNAAVVHVAADLRTDGWPQKLLAAGFDPELSTLFILEGVSMYLDGDDLSATFFRLRGLGTNADDRLWVDHVTETLLRMERKEVTSFLSTMSRLGESFVTGFQDASAFSNGGWTTIERRTTAEVLDDDSDPIHAEYVFSLLAPSSTSQAALPGVDHA